MPAARASLEKFTRLKRQTLQKMHEAGMTDKEKTKAESLALFQAADANQDSLLTLEEFLDFQDRLFKHQTEKYGESQVWTDQEKKEQWQIMNKINPEVEGVSWKDFEIVGKAVPVIIRMENEKLFKKEKKEPEENKKNE